MLCQSHKSRAINGYLCWSLAVSKLLSRAWNWDSLISLHKHRPTWGSQRASDQRILTIQSRIIVKWSHWILTFHWLINEYLTFTERLCELQWVSMSKVICVESTVQCVTWVLNVQESNGQPVCSDVWDKSRHIERKRIFKYEYLCMMKDWGVREQVVVIMPVHYSTWSSLWHN